MPYLHGKQEELFALLDLGSTLTQVVVPIVKPVNLSPPNQRRLARIAANSRFALITNSDKGRHMPALLLRSPLHPCPTLHAYFPRSRSAGTLVSRN